MFRIRSRYLFILLLGIYSFLNIKFTEGDAILSLPFNDLIFASIILLLTLLIWEGNRLISQLLLKRTFAKLSIRLVTHFGASFILVGILSVSASLLTAQNLATETGLFAFNQILGFTFRINLFLHCINAIMAYNEALSISKVEAETLKNQNTEARLDALRKQINPHFLFNSFNVLSSVIETDPDLAVNYVNQLSRVYRYILKAEDLKKISLEEEMDFIESYIFLLKMRFNQNLSVAIDIDSRSGSIPPATLQLLIENAIKHNEISKKFPLTISIEREGELLTVTNNRASKENNIESSNVGLANIENRYQLLSRKSIEVIDKTDQFIVKVPVLD